MKRKILLEILSLFLAFMFVGNLWAEESIMHPDRETLLKWMNDHINAPKAQKDESIERVLYRAESLGITTSMDLLDHIEYVTADRSQGNCGDCWLWAGTGIMEIAHSVQNGVLDRLSVQFLNSCRVSVPGFISYACCGGNLDEFSSFYNAMRFAVPWDNTNAAFDDGERGCADGSSLVSCGSISIAPNYPINSIEVLSIDTWTPWVDQAQAIVNIKNVLNQNKGVYFGFYLPDRASWDEFRSFWRGAGGETEATLWNPNQYCNTPWNTDEGGGHAVLILGYNEDDADPANHYWLALNSWGNGQGTRPNGFFRIPMSINYKCTYFEESWLSWYFSTLDVEFGNVLPISNAGGPYTEECEDLQATVQLDGAGSSDPEGFPLQYSWITDCPGGAFSDATVANPILTIDASSGCIINCTVLLTVTDNGGLSDTDSGSVNIRDTIPPTITCPPDKSIECSASTEPSNTGAAIATDDCSPNPSVGHSDAVTAGSCPQKNTITRTWEATDDCNNSASCSQTINVVDTVPPTLVGVPGNQTVQCDAVPTPAVVTATDNCDTSVDPSFNETRVYGNCASNYTLTRTWTAADDCVNTSIGSQIITVQDTVGPIISCNNPTTMTPTQVPTSFTATASDNCSTPTVQITNFSCYTVKKGVKSRNTSCVVNIAGDKINILNSGGVDDNIAWTVHATDGCANSSDKTCTIKVVNPKK